MATFIESDFTFNGISSSTYNIKLVTLESSGLTPIPIAGGRSVNEEYVPFRDMPFFYHTEVQPQEINLAFTIIGANPFTETVRTNIFDWLFSPRTYCDFVSADNLNKVYKIIFTSPLQFNAVDLTNGYFELTAMSYPYAYTPLTTYTNTVNPTSITINNLTNVRNYNNTYYYYPIIYADLTGGATSVRIVNTSDNNRVFEITGCSALEQLYIDNSLKIINSSVTGANRFSTLTNRQWLRLVKGSNVLQIETTCDLTIQCQYPIMI